MRQSIATTLRSCHECQVVQPRTICAAQKPSMACAGPWPFPSVWEQVTLDLITGLPESRGDGYDSCEVFVDRLSKMVHYTPTRKTIDARGMAQLFIMELPYVTLPSIVRYCTRIMALQHDTLHSTLLGAHAGKLVHSLVKWWPITASDISMESSHQGPSENVFACVL